MLAECKLYDLSPEKRFLSENRPIEFISRCWLIEHKCVNLNSLFLLNLLAQLLMQSLQALDVQINHFHGVRQSVLLLYRAVHLKAISNSAIIPEAWMHSTSSGERPARNYSSSSGEGKGRDG